MVADVVHVAIRSLARLEDWDRENISKLRGAGGIKDPVGVG